MAKGLRDQANGKTLEVNLPGPSSDLGKKTNSDISERRWVRGDSDHAHFSTRNAYKL